MQADRRLDGKAMRKIIVAFLQFCECALKKGYGCVLMIKFETKIIIKGA